MRSRFSIHREHEADVAVLHGRMREFYDNSSGYYEETGQQAPFWKPIVAELRRRCAGGQRCRVLEFGAGRTAFGAFLAELRPHVEYHVQDVTDVNAEHLNGQADAVKLGDILEIDGTYDVIFSTFVWEHLCYPQRTLEHLLKLLAPGGCLMLVSPRYDVPGYIPPSARMLPIHQRALLSAWLSWRRARVLLGGSPDFFVHCAPACLSHPWYQDADAVHWVSALDMKALGSDWRVEHITIPTHGWKHWLWSRVALLFVRISRHSSALP
jgi:SAM-dependent methyltransferase